MSEPDAVALSNLVDSHCHLDRLSSSKRDNHLDVALTEARQHGVSHMLCVCVDLESWPQMAKLAAGHDNISLSVGVHPCYHNSQEPSVEQLLAIAQANDQVVALGETGLDYFKYEGDIATQQRRFICHIEAAKACAKPLIIHTREARQDTLRLLAEHGAEQTGGVFHCFAEDWQTAERALELGFYISFSGIVTFGSAKTLQQVAQRIPVDRFLIETDSPWLAPTPFRGQENKPAWVGQVARKLGKLRDEDPQVIADTAKTNFERLFKKKILN